MIFFDGYIGAPPTVTVFSFICARAGAAGAIAAAKAITAAEANKAIRLDIGVSIYDCWRRGEPAGETTVKVVVGFRYGRLLREFQSHGHGRVNDAFGWQPRVS